MKNFNRIIILLLLVFASQLYSCRGDRNDNNMARVSDKIRINQVGFESDGPKRFILIDSEATAFKIIDESGKERFEGQCIDRGRWEASGESVKMGDLTAFSDPGDYRVLVDKEGISLPFMIGNNVYMDAAIDGTKSFYLQRASMDIDQRYAGVYMRQGGHPDTVCYYHESTGRTSGYRSSPGGWYDAGDYGKYIVNAAITVGTMLALHEVRPAAFPDGSLWIPESDNNKNDLLDEIKYELDWMLTMQDEDGGVFHKLTTKHFEGFVMPADAVNDRYIIGKSTAATLDFAASMSMSARIYKSYDPVFAEECLSAAIKAWSWACMYPENYYAKNPEDIHTGAYNDTILDEEWFWAAAELFITTGEDKYYKVIKDQLDGLTFRVEESWRNYVDNIGYYSLITPISLLPDNEKEVVKNRLFEVSDSLSMVLNAHPYRIPVNNFKWGSNSDFLNAAMLFTVAWHYTGNQVFRNNVYETLDYIFGKNATGYSFITGYGSLSPMNIHHRQSAADDVLEPYPGFVVGGPNDAREDETNLKTAGKKYENMLPARSYVDATESFASNEICINWNAPFVFVVGYFSKFPE